MSLDPSESTSDSLADVSVVICAYTEQRWDELLAAVRSVEGQSLATREIIVVIDNNPALLARVREALPDVIAEENSAGRGAGQARNRAVGLASGSIIAFLDDDAVATPEWIERATAAFEDPRVIGVGGTIEPIWEARRPPWMAEEFYWTLGCTYPGLPTKPAPIRNLIAANMFVRREAFLELGGFRAGFGKTGTRSGTEETDLCIRANQRWPESIWLYDPTVAVRHRVSAGRTRLSYFVSRCYDEGIAKASIVEFVGGRDGLAAERFYTARILPRGFVRGVTAALRGDVTGLARSASIAIGLTATVAGYLVGEVALRRESAPTDNSADLSKTQPIGVGTKGGGVLVVGSGTHFISGVSHYTRYVAVALAERTPVSVILMRRLIPRALYPGRDRVGDETLTDEDYPPGMEVFDGVDWYWLPSMLGALSLLRRTRPEAVLFQWWTGSVLHSYVLLALAARLSGARIIIEIHEIQDTGEAKLAPVRFYVGHFGRWLMRMADAYIVHSEFDREALGKSFDIGQRPVRVVRHGPFSHYAVAESTRLREAPEGMCNILFFGTIRPYKGLEDLVQAFELLARDDENCWLTVVGETWEDWTQPIEMIKASKYRDRITLVNHYVSDAEVSRWFAGADIVSLPYRRSSASGPLHLTMDAGLPVVVTDVGGLTEAVHGYDGAVLVPGADPDRLSNGLREAMALRGIRFEDASSWVDNADTVLQLLTPGL
ncbi:MAG TPA: glycosyltransferase [Solirubrobacteraceae bacterium]|jgi:glycosyltransferase involved in cell wall biosynthesis/GT2 family glycosyltransferase|nr:glycosyltransferase [Solirubrobacteraceae bacterium]